MRVIRHAALAMILALTAVACAGSIDPNAPQDADEMTIGVPRMLGGLRVRLAPDAIERLQNELEGSDHYVRDGQVFELRKDGELRAIYQVVRLTPDARAEDFDFRRALASAIGSSSAPENVNGVAVYKTTRLKQIIHTWFEDKFMQVLIVSETAAIQEENELNVPQLLNEVLALEPVPVGALGT